MGPETGLPPKSEQLFSEYTSLPPPDSVKNPVSVVKVRKSRSGCNTHNQRLASLFINHSQTGSPILDGGSLARYLKLASRTLASSSL